MNLDRRAKSVNPPRGSVPHGDFGAKGDLSRWRLIPAIGNLAAANLLFVRLAIVGFAFDPLTTESLLQQLCDEIKTLASSPIHPEFCQSCARALSGSTICDRRRGWRLLCSPENSPEQTRQWSILGIGMLVV